MNEGLANLLPGCATSSARTVTSNGTPVEAGEFRASRATMDASKSRLDPETMPGEAIHHGVCEKCHNGLAPKLSACTFTEMMKPEAIDRVLTLGIVREETAGLSVTNKPTVAEYLSGIRSCTMGSSIPTPVMVSTFTCRATCCSRSRSTGSGGAEYRNN